MFKGHEIFTGLFCALMISGIVGQDTIRIKPPAHRTIYGEAFGQALNYSLN
jgi:hypothetical protein